MNAQTAEWGRYSFVWSEKEWGWNKILKLCIQFYISWFSWALMPNIYNAFCHVSYATILTLQQKSGRKLFHQWALPRRLEELLPIAWTWIYEAEADITQKSFTYIKYSYKGTTCYLCLAKSRTPCCRCKKMTLICDKPSTITGKPQCSNMHFISSSDRR